MNDESRRRSRTRWGPRRWHRYLGAVFALPLLWLCVTGLLLQHQDRLGLTDRKVSSSWLLKRYGQIPDGEPRETRAGRFTVAEWDEILFRDGEVLEESGRLVGAVALPSRLVVATERELFVYGSQGEFLDRLGEVSLPGVPLSGVGSDAAGVLWLAVGERTFLVDADLLGFEARVATGGIAWSELQQAGGLRADLQAALAEGAGFTWSRVVTDLHSGSLFGPVGRRLVDVTGVAVIVLTLFGFRLLVKRVKPSP